MSSRQCMRRLGLSLRRELGATPIGLAGSRAVAERFAVFARWMTALPLLATMAAAAQQPFLGAKQWESLRTEASGAAAYDNLRKLTQLHRVPGTRPFDDAAAFILTRAKEYDLGDAHLEEFPIDGKIHYGLMRSHMAWSVTSGSLWQITPEHTLLGDWTTDPIHLADYSRSANVRAALVDVGAGVAESDYAGRDVRGELVLADGVLSQVQHLAIERHGAAGIVSDMPNQRTAWFGLDPTLIRWGHMDATEPGFAFMVSSAAAQALRRQMARGAVTLEAKVEASVAPGHWTVVTATIPGTDAGAGEIVFSCHLDHQRPGANDNASGCVSILETARVLQQLIGSGQLPRPRRTIRFLWGPEIEGTMAFLASHPELRRSMRGNIHMDMVGGDYVKDKAVLHITETPWSLPSFLSDIGDVFGEALREASVAYAEEGGDAEAASVEIRDGASGSRDAFVADETPYAQGSDHDVYDSATVAIPSLYLRDWPDTYIHTDHDTLAMIDPTKLRRVVTLGAAAGYTYAEMGGAEATAWMPIFAARSEQRLAKGFERAQRLVLDPATPPHEALFEAQNLVTQMLARERATLLSVTRFAGVEAGTAGTYQAMLSEQTERYRKWLQASATARGVTDPRASGAATNPQASQVPVRVGDFGPLTYQNDDVLRDRLGAEALAKVELLSSGNGRFVNVQDRSSLYAYEILNFVDGHRSVRDIRDAVSAEFGPIPIGVVRNYLSACRDAGIVIWR